MFCWRCLCDLFGDGVFHILRTLIVLVSGGGVGSGES